MELFGKEKKCFDLKIVNKLLSEEKISEAKTYIMKYFIKVYQPMAVLMWDPNDNDFKIISYTEAKQQFFIKSAGCKYSFFDPNGKKTELWFSLQKWFFEKEDTLFLQTMSRNQPRLYINNNDNCVNRFKGYKWDNLEKIEIPNK